MNGRAGALALGMGLAISGFAAMAVAAPLDTIDSPRTYDACVADAMARRYAEGNEEAVRAACYQRFVQRSSSGASMGQDASYNPFVSWVVDLSGSRGFTSIPDPRIGHLPFSRFLTDPRAEGLRAVARTHEQALERVSKQHALVSDRNVMRIAVKNDNPFGLVGITVGVTGVRQDECRKSLSGYAGTVTCTFPGGRLDAGAEGEVSCAYPGSLVIGTVCIVGFQSSWISVDDLIRYLGR
ncbi:exported hypothetical protein [Candidatus Terasakiella magnetica]|nr:exported hypothetical protein [Candidatus Terasakiella magnetica]